MQTWPLQPFPRCLPKICYADMAIKAPPTLPPYKLLCRHGHASPSHAASLKVVLQAWPCKPLPCCLPKSCFAGMAMQAPPMLPPYKLLCRHGHESPPHAASLKLFCRHGHVTSSYSLLTCGNLLCGIDPTACDTNVDGT